MPIWSEQRVRQLRDLVASDMTVTQVAAAMGTSRGLVAAKAKRMGFTFGRPQGCKTVDRSKPRPEPIVEPQQEYVQRAVAQDNNFCDAMLRAIRAGRERPPIGIVGPDPHAPFVPHIHLVGFVPSSSALADL